MPPEPQSAAARRRPLLVAEGEEPQEEEAVAAELHGRPQMVTPYVPPRDELEQQLASIWQ